MFALIFAFLTVILLVKLNEILGMAIGFRKDAAAHMNFASETEQKTDTIATHDEILKHCRGFEESDFLNKAQRVFEMVFAAYAAGDLGVLKDLLAPKLYTAFEMAIKDRASKGEILSGSIERIVSVNIDSTKIDKNKMLIDVMFVSEQVNVLKNCEGKIIEGSDDFVNSVREIWTFSRSINSNSKQWYLTEISYISGNESA